jgi:transposase
MLTVEHYVRIRRKVIVEGSSQREAARELGHGRRTVKKALENPVPPPYTRTKTVAKPVMDPVSAIIDAWLEEDTHRPRKQRHTASRIYQRLRDEYGFEGAEITVRKYVAQKKASTGEVYMPLQFDPGEEAQIDWGDGWIIERGALRKVLLFCMRLCYSTASFVRAYESQNQESLLDGHVRGFEYFRGVSRRCAFDNPKTIVITVGKGQDRTLTKRFLELKSHYLFDVRFCNIAKGNEKGHVENLVKHSQRTFLTPIPEVSGIEDLNERLMESCLKDLARRHNRLGKTVGELLDEERARFLPLPAQAFDPCKQVSSIATKLSLVRFDTNDYSVPVEYAHHMCVIKGFVDRVDIFVEGSLVASHGRSYESAQFVLDWHHYVPLLERKPGSLNNARPFKGQPWGRAFTEMHEELKYRYGDEGTRKFIKILLLLTEYPERDVKDAVAACVKRCAFSDEAVLSTLTFEPRKLPGTLDLAGRPDLELAGAGTRPAGLYDTLLGREVLA